MHHRDAFGCKGTNSFWYHLSIMLQFLSNLFHGPKKWTTSPDAVHFPLLLPKTILPFFSFYLFIRATALLLTTDASFTATKFKIIIVLIPFKIVNPVIFSGAKVQPCPYTDKYLGYNIHLLPFFLTKVKTKGIWSPFLRFMRASQPVTCPPFFLYVT